jgi:Glyoxalase-like domain
MKREFDHLVIAAASLEQGAAWVESRLGVAPGPGGKHATMGTHNRLLSLGPGRFLEVIAIDPDAPPPERPRWFELDTSAMRERLARSAALVHWVERTGDLQAATRDYLVPVDITAFARGAYRWKMALTRDGTFPAGGQIATLIQWEGAHPADALPDAGVRLDRFTHEGGALAATFSTPAGARTIP